MYKVLKIAAKESIINNKGIFASAFLIETIKNNNIISGKLSKDLVDITKNFNNESTKTNTFMDAGFITK